MTHIDSYALGVCLSENGAFGRVYLAKHIPSNQYCALKVISKNDVEQDKDMADQLKEEVRIQKLVDHPNIVQIKEVMEDDQYIYLSVEHALRGDLFDVLYSGKTLEKNEIKKIFFQLISAVEYVHKNAIIHRDIKLENILMNEFGDIKLTDFGSAVDTKQCKPDELETICGTNEYIAPEILGLRDRSISSHPYNEKIDIWACGIVLYELLCQKHPYPDKYFKMNKKNIRKRLLKHKLRFPEYVEDAEKQLIQQCLDLDPQKRPSASDILQNPWLANTHKLSKLRPAESALSIHSHSLTSSKRHSV